MSWRLFRLREFESLRVWKFGSADVCYDGSQYPGGIKVIQTFSNPFTNQVPDYGNLGRKGEITSPCALFFFSL